MLKSRPRPLTEIDYLEEQCDLREIELERNFNYMDHCSYCVNVLDILVDYQNRHPSNETIILCAFCLPLYKKGRRFYRQLPKKVCAPVDRECRYCLFRRSTIQEVKEASGEYVQFCFTCLDILARMKVHDKSRICKRSEVFEWDKNKKK